MLGKPKAVPPDHPDYVEWITSLAWRLSGMLSSYVRGREVFTYLRKEGYLSAAITDHELAYDYAMRSGDNDKVKEYFAFIMKGGKE